MDELKWWLTKELFIKWCEEYKNTNPLFAEHYENHSKQIKDFVEYKFVKRNAQYPHTFNFNVNFKEAEKMLLSEAEVNNLLVFIKKEVFNKDIIKLINGENE